MTLGISGLIAAYIVLAVLLLSINLYSKWSWQVKAITIIITSAFYIISYFSFPPLLGWPTKQALPSHFRLLSSEVHQPDKLAGTEGAVYLWLKEVEDITTYVLPRAYVLPYSNLLHERIIHAQSKIDQGIPQLGEYEKDDSMRVEVLDSSETGKESLDIQFYDLPDPLFPEK
jgi:hypothetical protein